MSQSSISYQDIFAPNYSVTGIRQDDGEGHPVIITGSHQLQQKPQALLYRGPLLPTDPAGYIYMTPHIDGEPSIVSSIMYGPNTSLFDPALGAGNVRVVGSCKFDGTETDHGIMYLGPLDGSGTWTLIDVPAAAAPAPVGNTIAHSTMGDLVVGNYDLAGVDGSGNGFIYSISKQSFTVLQFGNFATLYGVWQNGIDSSSYTLVGGSAEGPDVNRGFMIDYDASSGAFGKLTGFTYNNVPGIYTHFEGITGFVDGTYTVAAQWKEKPDDASSAAFARIVRDSNSAWFAEWFDVANPAGPCTANSVLENNVIGIYKTAGGIQSYVATVAPQQGSREANRERPERADALAQ